MQRERGFTLVEVMVVVGIAGVMAGLAIGMGGEIVRRQDFNAITREVYSAMNMARSHAIRNNQRVHVTFEATQIYAFVDADDDHVFDAETETAVYAYPPSAASSTDRVWPADISLAATSGSDTQVINDIPTAIFDSRGFSIGDDGSFAEVSITVTDAQLTLSSIVDSTVAGSIRVRR